MDLARRRLRTPAAADYIGVSPRSLEKWRLRGGGPRYLKAGRAVVYDTRDLDGWLDAHARTSTSDDGSGGRPAA